MKRLTRLRLERQLPQLTVCYRARIPVSDLSRFENGRAVPYPQQLQRLAKFFRVAPETLLDDVDPPDRLSAEVKAPRPPRRKAHRRPEVDVGAQGAARRVG